MQVLVDRVLDQAQERGFVPKLPEKHQVPLPAVNKVELYLSFHGNDSCSHCITCSGPHRHETMSPRAAKGIIDNVAEYSILRRISDSMGAGNLLFMDPESMEHFDTKRHPPRQIQEQLFEQYADAIMGKGGKAVWLFQEETKLLNFGRPSIRLSGGEFSTWPHEIEGKPVPLRERPRYQLELLSYIRQKLPEYDIWILTNGRFASTDEETERFLSMWAPMEGEGSDGRTRICISIDGFHRPPKRSTKDQMLQRIWRAARVHGLPAPYLYGITRRKVFLVGRALENYLCGKLPYTDELDVDPVDLQRTDGCNELKGFVVNTRAGVVLSNNIVVKPDGHLAYCCAGIGDYGNGQYG